MIRKGGGAIEGDKLQFHDRQRDDRSRRFIRPSWCGYDEGGSSRVPGGLLGPTRLEGGMSGFGLAGLPYTRTLASSALVSRNGVSAVR